MKSKSNGRLLVENCVRVFTKCTGFFNKIVYRFRKTVANIIFAGICTDCGSIITEDDTYSHQISFSCPNNCGFEAFPESLKQCYSGYPKYLGGDSSCCV